MGTPVLQSSAWRLSSANTHWPGVETKEQGDAERDSQTRSQNQMMQVYTSSSTL